MGRVISGAFSLSLSLSHTIHTYVFINTCMYIYMCIHMYIYIYICIHMERTVYITHMHIQCSLSIGLLLLALSLGPRNMLKRGAVSCSVLQRVAM